MHIQYLNTKNYKNEDRRCHLTKEFRPKSIVIELLIHSILLDGEILFK